MKKLFLVLLVVFASACGSTAPAHHGPDVVTAEWTAGDDAPLDAPAP
jgi:hypothetical protein